MAAKVRKKQSPRFLSPLFVEEIDRLYQFMTNRWKGRVSDCLNPLKRKLVADQKKVKAFVFL